MNEKIGVVGGGLMGHGIAWLFAAAGHDVGLFEPAAAVRAAIPQRLAEICALLGEDAGLVGRVAVHAALAPAVAGADFVFEAAPEKLPLKQKIFHDLEGLVSKISILASNSSALPASEIGRQLRHRERVVGTHFWNPPHLVPLVEVIQAEATSDAVVQRTLDLLRRAGKKPVHVKKDIPGFIGNRLQHALKREAIALLADGVCDAETLDAVVRDGFGARLAVLGPLEQSDLVGLDLTLDIHATLLAALDRTPGPHPLLRRKVAEGKLGMQSGEGFRRWTPDEAEAVRRRLREHLAAAARAQRAERKG